MPSPTPPKPKPRRSSGEHTLSFREDRSRWEARVVIGYNDKGNPLRKSKQFSSKTEAQRWVQAQGTRASLGQLSASGNITLEHFAREWLEEKKATVRHNTFHNYEFFMVGKVVPGLGGIRLSDLSALHVSRWIAGLRKDGLSVAAIWRSHFYLRLMLNEAVRLELTHRNVASSVKVAKPPKRILLRWSQEEAKKVLDWLEERRHALLPYVYLGLTTGLRREELLGLRWSDLDPARALLHVRQTAVSSGKTGKLTLEEQTKTTDSRRTLSLDAGTLTLLERQRVWVAEMRSVAKTWEDNNLVLPSSVGTPFASSTLNKNFARVCEEVGVPRIRPYDLRSTWASVALEAGVPVKSVSERLGHKDIHQTLQTYVRTDEKARQGAALDVTVLYGVESARVVAGGGRDEENSAK